MGEVCPTCGALMTTLDTGIWWCSECGTVMKEHQIKRPAISQTVQDAINRKIAGGELYEEHEVVCKDGKPPDLSKRHGDDCCCEEGK